MRNFSYLVVCLLLDPSAGIPSHQEATSLVINEDDEGEWHRNEPPIPLGRIHAQHGVSSRTISQESGQKRLLEKTGDQDIVVHALLHDRQTASLADDHVSPILLL